MRNNLTLAKCKFLRRAVNCFGIIQGASDNKESPCKARDLGLIPGSGRSLGEGNGTPLQSSCLKIPWMEKPGRLQSMGSRRVGHDSSDLVRMPEVSVYDICALTWLPHKQCFLLWVEVSQS